MPYVLDDRILPIGVPFEHDGVRYPANWLQLSTETERLSLGIEWQPEPEPYNQMFYWAPDVPKDHGQLVGEWVYTVKGTAYSLMQASDWLFTRELDSGVPAPQAWRDWRESVRQVCKTKVAAIRATATTEELAAYVMGAEYAAWPRDPNASAEPAASDGVQPAVGSEEG